MHLGTAEHLFASITAHTAEAPQHARPLLTGKLTAILAGALALGVAFAAFPLRPHAATRLDVLAVALVLGLHVAAYAMGGRGGARARLVMPLLTLAGLPMAALLHATPLAAGAMAALALLCAAFEAALVLGARRFLVPLAALAVPALVALGVGAPLPGVMVAGLLLLLPALVACLLPAPAPDAAVVPREGALALNSDLLCAALAPEGRVLLVCDAMGVIDAALTPDLAAVSAHFPDASLTEATLIADRVHLLQQLARAARESITAAPVTLRLREGHGGAGYPVPPRYANWLLRAFALPGHPGRAGVILEPAVLPEALPVAAPAGANPAQLARALHDGLAPFNAGLGFLEMVADPRLAPRDFSVLHDFASEAHKAMAEAHRNASLLGLWLRLNQDEAFARARADVAPRRLLTEAQRLLNIEDMEKRCDLRASAGFEAPYSYTLPVNAARFGLCVLLRFGASAPHVDLHVAEDGADLVVTLQRRAGGEGAVGADSFQQALEQAAAALGGAAFEDAGPGARALRLVGAVQSRRMAEAIRQAS